MARSRGWRRTTKISAVSHRWLALVLGVLLILEVVSGVALLFRPDVYQLGHPELLAGTPSAHPISQQQALDVVAQQRPRVPVRFVTTLPDVYEVVRTDATTAYVDAGAGRLLGIGSASHDFMAFLLNLHDCMLSCPQYAGYLPFMAAVVPGLGIKVGALVLGVLGLAFVWLIVSGLVAWWPGVRRFARGLRIHRGRGSYRFNRDLHDVLGVLAVPTLLMWAVTGTGYEFPFVGDAWYAITGSAGPPSAHFTSRKGEGPDITPDQAIAAGHAALPDGRLLTVTLPPSSRPTATYQLAYDLGVPAASYAGVRAFGDTTVAVDRRDARRTAVISGGHTDVGERLWTKWNYGVHFGYAVPWGWRLVWVAFGVLPLILAYTGMRTWLVRALLRRRRRRRGTPVLEPETTFLR